MTSVGDRGSVRKFGGLLGARGGLFECRRNVSQELLLEAVCGATSKGIGGEGMEETSGRKGDP